jgi:sugar-specific transcriptional regulator TrmB
MNKKLLEEIGLTKGEITVYLTLLKLGETTTGKVIENAQISSGKIYEILDKLIQKGLVSFIIKDKTKYFSSASPKRILDYVQEKENSLREKEKELIKELPSLLAIEKTEERKQEMHLFKGIKGIQTAIFEALENLTPKDQVLAMGVISSKNEEYNILWEKWHAERMRKKVICKLLFSDKDTIYYKAFKKMKFTQTRVSNGITPSAIDIMKDRVLIFTYGDEPSCLVIKNFEVAKSFETFFNTLWTVSK